MIECITKSLLLYSICSMVLAGALYMLCCGLHSPEPFILYIMLYLFYIPDCCTLNAMYINHLPTDRSTYAVAGRLFRAK